MSAVATAIIGGAVIGGLSSSHAASQQSDAANNATAAQQQMFNTTYAQGAPYRGAGSSATGRLSWLMGLPDPGGTAGAPGAPGGGAASPNPGYAGGPNPGYGAPGAAPPVAPTAPAGPPQDYNAIRTQLLPQFTKPGEQVWSGGSGAEQGGSYSIGPPTIDEAGLQAAINQHMQQASQAPAQGQPMGNLSDLAGGGTQTFSAALTPASADLSAPGGIAPGNTASGGAPAPGGFGSLNTPFDASMLNSQNPSYEFQRSQGQQALQNSQAATDGVLSGAALKSLMGYNQSMAATGYQNAFNNYNQQQNQTYARLSGLASTGENAAVNAGNTGAQTGSNMASTMIGAGNANAAGTMGVANAVTGGINGGVGYMQLNNLTGGGNLGGPITYGANPGGVYTAGGI